MELELHENFLLYVEIIKSIYFSAENLKTEAENSIFVLPKNLLEEMQKLSLFDPDRTLRFITGSTYEGDWSSATQNMEGFGCYTFPNGNVYRGYFRSGKFHGSGLMKAGSPYNFIVYGEFEEGRLGKIDKMVFNDGLRVYGDMKDDGMLDLSSWKYCCGEDRRFLKEIKEGLRGVGTINLAATDKDGSLKPGFYDNEEGIFNVKNGFLSERPLPFKPTEFIGCLKKIRWIKRHCREGRATGETVEPTEEFCRSILENNIRSQKWADANFGAPIGKGQRVGCKYFSNLYEMELKEAEMAMKGEQESGRDSFIDEDTKSSSSLLDITPPDTVLLERVFEKPKSPCKSDGSLSIDMGAVKMRKSLYG